MTPEQFASMRASWADYNRTHTAEVAAKRAALIRPYLKEGHTETLAIMRMPPKERRKVRDYDRVLREQGR